MATLIHNIGSLMMMDKDVPDLLDGAIIIEEGLITWLGLNKQVPQKNFLLTIDAHGCVVLPGLIDCHTHILFAGSRADEFARRMNNEPYEDIMKKGGGIAQTTMSLAKASDEELFTITKRRLDRILKLGVTTVEAKSGYGLCYEQEMRSLRILKELNLHHAIDIHPTFLGAHIIPKEYAQNRSTYVDMIVAMLSDIKDQALAKDCDVFCETGAFSVGEAKKILSRAHDLGFGLRAHVQQLNESGGVSLVRELPLKSISHADFINDDDIKTIVSSNVVVEALPFAALFLRSKKRTPVELLRAHDVPVALASDFNPGSAMCDDLILAARLGVVYGGFSLHDALCGITQTAAQALGYDDRGVIKIGNVADVVITNCSSINEIFYDWTKHPIQHVIKRGQMIT